MAPLARDVMRATIRKRREQKLRNAEALAEEEERLRALPGYKPPRRKMLRVGSPENKMVDPVEDDKAGPWFPLEDVPWASPQAYARAVNLGLTGLMFDAEDYTGKRGFTAGDVNRIAKESEQ